MSIQSFLDGLFDTQCYPTPNPISPTSTLTDRLYDPNVTKEEPIPSLDKNHRNSRKLVTVQVRDVHHDPLNAFDRNPTLIAKLVSEVMHSTEFLLRDGKAASLAARLANILPGLMRKKSNTNTTATSATTSTTSPTTTASTKTAGVSNDFSRHAPSRINWVEATDHFVCRKAHEVELSKFTEYENQDEHEQTLQALSYPTMAHLTWRFRMWYQHERLLALIAAPPLREITNQMIATPNLLPTEKRPMVLYSCHDITILGLLYAIGADFLSVGSTRSSNSTIDNISIPDGDDDNDGYILYDIQDVGTWRYWPSYGSHLVFELVRIHEGDKEALSPGLSSSETHVIRILLDGVPVRSSKINHSSTNYGSIQGMFTVKSFDELVKNLEDAGGFDYDSLLGKKET